MQTMGANDDVNRSILNNNYSYSTVDSQNETAVKNE